MEDSNLVTRERLANYHDELMKDVANPLGEKKANIDGFYEGMGVGVAKRLEGNTDVAGSFLERTTGGDAELANGLAQLNEVQGGSVKFNQLVQNGNFSDGFNNWEKFTVASIEVVNNTLVYNIDDTSVYNHAIKQLINVTANHKLFVRFQHSEEEAGYISVMENSYDSNGTVLVRVDSSSTVKSEKLILTTTQTVTAIVFRLPNKTNYHGTLSEINIIDLTAIFGSGNEPATVAEFEAWLAENVGVKDYYDYTEGEVVNNNMTGIESNGFNLFNPTTGKARIIGAYSEAYGNYYGITGTYGTLTFEDDLGNVSTVTPDADGKFELDVSGYLSVADAGNDVAVFLWWDGKKTEYEDYDVDIAHLDVRHIYGKKNGTGELVQVWPTGMPRIDDVVDKLCIENGAVVAKRPIAEVDMGTLTWSWYSENSRFQSNSLSDRKYGTGVLSVLCAKYPAFFEGSGTTDKTLGVAQGTVNIFIHDSSYTDVATLTTAMSGVKLYYELATPETYTDLVYMGSEYFADGTPVALPVNYKVDNWGVETILPKNTSTILTAKPTIKVRYAIDAVEQLNTHSDEIEDLYDGLDELDDAKANTVGVYDDLVVGAAKAIAGNQRLDKVFTSMVVDGADGVAKINEVRGKSLVWNQQAIVGSTTNTVTNNGVVFTAGNDGKMTIVGVASDDVAQTCGFSILMQSTTFVRGHKYYLSIGHKEEIIGLKFGVSGYSANSKIPYISVVRSADAASDWNNGFVFSIKSGTSINVTITPQAIDLTLMFGTGNEPATVEEFEVLFPDAYYEYNDGEIINNATEELDVTGFNQWDEEWEAGVINSTTGQNNTGTEGIRSKNYIPVFPNLNYYYRSAGVTYINPFFYDANKQYIGQLGTYLLNNTFAIPSGVYYIRFALGMSYGTAYNHDICINISDPSRNGTYEPYKHGVVPLNLTTITGKQVGVEDAESVVIFPDGMRQAGSVADTLIVDDDGYARRAVVKFGSVDLGTLTWNKTEIGASPGFYRFVSSDLASYLSSSYSNIIYNCVCEKYLSVSADDTYSKKDGIGVDIYKYLCVYDSANQALDAAAFKTAMSGVLLCYELAEYKEYILDEPILMTFKAYHGGTIVQSPQAPDSSPMSMNVTFALDAVGTLNNLPQNYISADSMDAFLAQLGTAMNGTWTKSWDAANNRYGFTFTPNTEGE